jgi:subfamily B ATP-binding cassette protein MsbA
MEFHRPRAFLFGLTVFFMVLTAVFNGVTLATIVPFTEIVLRSGVPGQRNAATGAPAAPAPAAASASAEIESAPAPSVTPPPAAGSSITPASGLAAKLGGESLGSLRGRLEARFNGLLRGQDRMATLGRFCVLVLLLFLLKNACWYIQSYLSVFIEQRAIRDMRDRLFGHYQALSLDYFQGAQSGVLVSRITNDADLVRGAVANGLMELLRDSFSLLTCLLLALFANARLFVWAIVILIPSMFLIDRLGTVLRRISRVSQEKMAQVTSVVGETIRGIRILKAFGAEEHQARRFMRETADYCRSLVRMTRIGSLGTPLTELAGAAVAVALIYIGGRRIIVEGAPPGYFLLFLAAFLSMMSPLKAIHQLNLRIQQGLAAGKRIFEILDAVPSVREIASPHALPDFKQAIRFEGVGFAYEPGLPVLRSLDIEIPQGKAVALVGPSGGGKSTLIHLIPRFYDPVAGRITIDGIDLREVRVSDLRRLIGLVTQETILFHDTVADNIRLGNPAASDAEIEQAARSANAHDFIMKMPQGYGTLIGERGLRLSGGERQRLTIARAILKNPPILILDEATSALDTESERLVQDAIHRLLARRTAVVIAHRLSTIRSCDLILALDSGEIVERGTHDELIARRGLYHRLHQLQFAEAPARP